jgi:hypothetical protein
LGTTVIGDSDVLRAADNLTLNFYGSNNIVYGNSESINSYAGSFALNGNGDSVATSGSTLTANGIGFTLTEGNDTIVGDNDVLTLGSGTTNLTIQGGGETIALSDPAIKAASMKVSAAANGKDLLLTDSATGQQVIAFDGMLAAGNQGATQLKFADGTVWTRAQLLSKAHTAGTSNASAPTVQTLVKHSTDAQVTQLIHAMAVFSANHSGVDWTPATHSPTADAAVLTTGNHPLHQHRP